MIYQYKCKFYLNASHYIVINQSKGMPHSHCFEIIIDVAVKDEEQFMRFNDLESKAEDLLKKYQNKLINEIEPFDTINPTLENICGFFGRLFFEELKKYGWLLLTSEISETPTRSYVMSIAEERLKETAVLE